MAMPESELLTLRAAGDADVVLVPPSVCYPEMCVVLCVVSETCAVCINIHECLQAYVILQCVWCCVVSETCVVCVLHTHTPISPSVCYPEMCVVLCVVSDMCVVWCFRVCVSLSFDYVTLDV
jgi:hypothetical protein